MTPPASEALPGALRVHGFRALQPGPRLIALGAVHGNETCGTRAIERLIDDFDGGGLELARGRLTLVPVSNPLAYRLGRREGERNLNRNLAPSHEPRTFEDRVANVLCPLLAAHDVLLDLHSFHAPGEPFALCGPDDNDGDLEPFAQAAAETRLVAHLGVRRIVEGWMDAYAKGVARRRQNPAITEPALTDARYGVGSTEYLRAHGGYAVTLECGRHDDPAAPEVGYRALCQTLALLGMIAREPRPPAGPFEVIRLVDVTDREHADDRFCRAWSSFDRVVRGEPIARRRDGAVLAAPDDGYVVFPNASAAPGREWFYFARASDRRIG